MKNQAFLLLFLIATALSTSCNSSLSKQELTDYVNDPENNLSKTVQVNGIDYTLKYKPTDLIIDQFLSIEKLVNKSEVDSLQKLFKNHLYFKLMISSNQKEVLNALRYDKQLFGRTLNQLAFTMDKKLVLTNTRNDTIPLIDYSYARTFGTGSSEDLLFVFNDKENRLKQELTFTLKEFGLGSGNLKFRFNKKDIDHIPSLRFE